MRVNHVVRMMAVGMVIVFGALTPALATADSLRAVPFVFIGKTDECAFPPDVPAYPAGSRIVTAAWLGGMGLPDNGGPNTGANVAGDPIPLPDFLALPDPGTRRDPHRGLLLSKNGPTYDCSAAGARITGVRGMTFTELGFDYRNGGHCGAGAPRYNVVVKEPAAPVGTGTQTFHFVGGCANGTKTPAPQDPLQWTRVRFTGDQAFPPIPPGSKIVSVSLIFDEGTDSSSVPDDPNGVGLAVVDNLAINGTLITAGNGIADGTSGDFKDKKDNDSRNERDGHDGGGNDDD